MDEVDESKENIKPVLLSKYQEAEAKPVKENYLEKHDSRRAKDSVWYAIHSIFLYNDPFLPITNAMLSLHHDLFAHIDKTKGEVSFPVNALTISNE